MASRVFQARGQEAKERACLVREGGAMVPGKGCQKGHQEPLSKKGLAKGLALIVKMA